MHPSVSSSVPATSNATQLTPNPVASPMLCVSHLEKIYGSHGATTRALTDVTFDVYEDDFLTIMGSSGSGKSTLLNCVSGIDMPISGYVLVRGHDITQLRSRDLTQFLREQLGFIFQDANLLDTLTARENIALPLTIAHTPVHDSLARTESVARTLDIQDVLDKYPYHMSGGQQQRVAAARALVTNPALIMADEPTGSLDSKNARLLLEYFEALNHELQTTILMVTHDSFAASYTKRVLFIRDGTNFTEAPDLAKIFLSALWTS